MNFINVIIFMCMCSIDTSTSPFRQALVNITYPKKLFFAVASFPHGNKANSAIVASSKYKLTRSLYPSYDMG